MKYETAIQSVIVTVGGNMMLTPPGSEPGWRVRDIKVCDTGKSIIDPGKNSIGGSGSYSSRTITESKFNFLVILWERAIPETDDATPP